MQCSTLPAAPHVPAHSLRRLRGPAPRAARRRARSALTSACKVGEPAMSCFDCFLEAASPEKSIGQLGKAPPDHLAITEIDVNFERFTEIGKCRVPLFKTSLGHRKARQQVSPFSWVNGALMRQGRPEIAPRFLKCCGLKCALACQRQLTDQFLLVSERSCLEQMVSDLSGALVDGTGIEPLDRVGDAGVQSLSARGRDAGKQRLTHEFMGEGKRPLRAPRSSGRLFPSAAPSR